MDELKQRILRELKSSRFTCDIPSSEMQIPQDELDNWASENAIVYQVVGDEYVFAISPSLSAIKGVREGLREALSIFEKGATK